MALDVQKKAADSGINVAERGKNESLDKRLFMQLLAFGDCFDQAAVIAAVQASGITATVYADATDPYGIAVLFSSEDASHFTTAVRDLLHAEAFLQLQPKPEYTMFGRTYTIGYEENLEAVLIDRPRTKVANTDTPWAIWYPLKRKGAFEEASADEQRTMLREHGAIGMAYGRAGLGTDIRLACFGMDKNDNDFVIALLGKELAALSKIVERMRKTVQTRAFMEQMGPFFVGKIIYAQA